MARPDRPAVTSTPGADDLAGLAERARQGDAGALEQLLAELQDDVYRLALRMTGCPDDALDATQEVLIRVMTRLSTFRGQAGVRTWVYRITVNHLLDRRKSTVERLELSFDAYAGDLLAGLAPAVNADPDLDLLAVEVKRGCTLAVLTCLDRGLRVAYVLGEVFRVTSAEGAWICGTSEAAYRKRLSRARSAVREFLGEHCGLVNPDQARCHCRRRVPAAVALGRVDADARVGASNDEIDAAIAEMEQLYDAASLIRSLADHRAPQEVAVRITRLMQSGRYRLLTRP